MLESSCLLFWHFLEKNPLFGVKSKVAAVIRGDFGYEHAVFGCSCKSFVAPFLLSGGRFEGGSAHVSSFSCCCCCVVSVGFDLPLFGVNAV